MKKFMAKSMIFLSCVFMLYHKKKLESRVVLGILLGFKSHTK